MIPLIAASLILTSFLPFATANVEKTIFIASPPPSNPPSIPRPSLTTLTPSNSSIRTLLPAPFSSSSSPHGQSSWFFLDDLVPGQRYEVRVCWAATQPADFILETFSSESVQNSPELATSLSQYLQSNPDPYDPASPESHKEASSALYLRINASASFFTSDVALMRDPAPVLVDVILDPFLLNILPQSLAPTVGVIILVAVLSWMVARSVASRIEKLAAGQVTGPGGTGELKKVQ